VNLTVTDIGGANPNALNLPRVPLVSAPATQVQIGISFDFDGIHGLFRDFDNQTSIFDEAFRIEDLPGFDPLEPTVDHLDRAGPIFRITLNPDGTIGMVLVNAGPDGSVAVGYYNIGQNGIETVSSAPEFEFAVMGNLAEPGYFGRNSDGDHYTWPEDTTLVFGASAQDLIRNVISALEPAADPTSIMIRDSVTSWRLVVDDNGNRRIEIVRTDGESRSFNPEDDDVVDQILEFLPF